MTLSEIFIKTAKHFKMTKVDDDTYENDRFVLLYLHELGEVSVRTKDADADTIGAFTFIENGGYYGGCIYHTSGIPFVEYMMKLTEATE